MCYSFEVSITTWFVGVAISIYLYERNKDYDRWNALFVFTVITMQLVEAFLWKTIQYKNKYFNSIFTAIALVALMVQPLVNSYMGYLYTNQILLFYMTFMYILIIFFTLVRITTTSLSSFHSDIGPNCHLMWNDDSKPNFLGGNYMVIGILYIIGLLVPLIYMTPFNQKGLPLMSVGIITLVMSIINTNSTGEMSSLWCFLAILYGIVAMLT